jgi:hypothetical protein
MSEKRARRIPRLPDISEDRVLSTMLGVSGPDEIVRLSIDASEEVRNWLSQYGIDRGLLNQTRFESLIMPFMFAARRLGDIRGVAREKSMFAGLFPDREDDPNDP